MAAAAASQATLVKFLVTHAFYRADGAAAAAAAAPKKGKKKSSGGLVEEAGVAPLAEPLDGLREACAVRVSSLLEKNLKAQRAAAAGKEDKPAEKKPAKKEIVYEWEQVNTQKAIWLRSKEDCTDQEYNEFYKSVSKDYLDPLAHTHFNAEGEKS